jgi:hypothetical protein
MERPTLGVFLPDAKAKGSKLDEQGRAGFVWGQAPAAGGAAPGQAQAGGWGAAAGGGAGGAQVGVIQARHSSPGVASTTTTAWWLISSNEQRWNINLLCLQDDHNSTCTSAVL